MWPKVLLVTALAFILLTGGADALNLWMSNSIFGGMTLPAGYRGYTGQQISWGTRDNATYELSVSITGDGSRFFKKYKRKAFISNDKKYQYLVYLRIPRRVRPGTYSFTICGKVTYTWYGLALCKTAELNVTEAEPRRPRKLRG